MWGHFVNVKASELRRNLFSILDRCLETGETVEVERRKGIVELRPSIRRKRVAQLDARPDVLLDGDTLDSFSPSEWNPDRSEATSEGINGIS